MCAYGFFASTRRPPWTAVSCSDVGNLRGRKSTELHNLGRLPYPMVRRRGEAGFTRVPWEEALELVAGRLRETPPDRLGVYMTSRGQPNENYYAAQKAVRALGTNSIDSAARLCHSPSTAALKDALGVAATTCSYTDLIGTDLVVFVGSNVAQNQPVMMKYLYHARKSGTKVAVVNTYREPAMEHYWVPSNAESALFGTKMTDRFFQVGVGGDIAFLNGALKYMIEREWVDGAFIDGFTTGFARCPPNLTARVGGPRGCVGHNSPRDAGVRPHAGQRQDGGDRLEHGGDPAQLR